MQGPSDRGQRLISDLGRFPNLQHLGLEDADKLGVCFDPPWRDNAYIGPNGAEALARVEKEGEEARVKAAKMVGSACSELLDVWIGKLARFEIVRDGNGSFVDVIRHENEPREGVFWRFHS